MSNCTNNFIKRVIGVTRTFNLTITTNGAAVPLVAEDLTLQLVPPRGEAVSLPFDVDDNIVSFTWQGEDQHIIGCYSLILWANYGEDNQRRVDIHNFVELIPWSDRQSGEYSDLIEETIELETADFGENIMVVDNLNSTSATDALSANMGRQLNVTKQDVIADLAAIRSGAAAGAAVKEWAKNDPLITDDGTQVSASKLAFNGNLFEQWVPGIASSIGLKGIAGFLKLADISQWDSAYNDRMLPTVAAVKAKLQAVLTALATIEAVIPSQASSTNKLTDKDYVDGAIATNTANFVGTFDTLAELQAVQNPTKNDYGFVIESDAQGNEYYDRYKYTGTQWLFEYKVESTPFTAEQWAAIQSGITAALVSKLSALPTNAELNTALAAKQPVINDLTTIRSGAAAGATAYQKPSGGIPKTDLTSAVQTSLGKADSAYQKPSSGIPASDMASAVQTSLGKADSAYQKPSSGIPASDMASAVQTSLGKADSAYQKPSTGIPKTDLASAVQTSLGKADAAAPQSTTYTKTEVDAALALKQTSSQIATINGSDITHGGNVTIVAAEGQTITIDAAPTAGSNNAVSSGGVYNNVNGAAKQSLEFTAGQGLYANGTTFNNTTASITDFISVNEGDSISFEGSGANNYGAVAGYNASQVFVSNIITHTGSRINATVTIPSGIAYIRCAARNHTYNASTQDPEASLTTFDPYIRTSKAVSTEAQNLSDSAKEQARSNIDASISYIELNAGLSTIYDGYYRYSNGVLVFASASGWKVSEHIPIHVGDTIIAGTTVTAPYSTALNIFMNIKREYVAVAVLNNLGSITITQAMWDAGYRYLGISFKPDDTKTIVIKRPISKIVEATPAASRIRLYKDSANVFLLYVDSDGGDTLCYKFSRQYKVWDSLSYTDGDGVTQTAANIVSADYWNNDYIFVGFGTDNTSRNYILQGNTNFIYKLVGETSHVGNGHGCEVAVYRKFLLDGKELDIESMAVGQIMVGASFRYIQRSDCYATSGSPNDYGHTYPQLDTNGNPIVDCVHSMDCLFEVNNRVTIDNSLLIMRDNLKFVQCHGAMLESNYGKFSHVSVNNAEDTINAVSDAGVYTAEGGSTITLNSTADVLGTRACMYGKGFFVKQEIVPLDPSRVSKCNIMPTAYNDRLKLYFMPVGTTTSGSVVDAETFNTGDSIKVRAIREIECHMDEFDEE